MSNSNRKAARRKQALAKTGESSLTHVTAEHVQPVMEEGTMVRFEHYSGPVAHPAFGEAWERVVAGSGSRLIGMAEAQGKHRHHVEKVVVWGRTISANLGTLGATALGALAMYYGHDLLVRDKDAAGFAAFFVPLGALVWAFRRTSKPTPSDVKPSPRRKR